MALTLRDLLEQSQGQIRGRQQRLLGTDIAPDYGGVQQAIKKQAGGPGFVELIMPLLMNLLGPASGSTNEYLNRIRRGTQQDVAGAQTDALKRGITGSSIEAAAMGQARGRGRFAESNYLSQGSQRLAQMLSQGISGQLGGISQGYGDLAQLAGEEFGAKRDIGLFREQLQFTQEQAQANRDEARLAAMMKMGSSVVGAGMGGR